MNITTEKRINRSGAKAGSFASAVGSDGRIFWSKNEWLIFALKVQELLEIGKTSKTPMTKEQLYHQAMVDAKVRIRPLSGSAMEGMQRTCAKVLTESQAERMATAAQAVATFQAQQKPAPAPQPEQRPEQKPQAVSLRELVAKAEAGTPGPHLTGIENIAPPAISDTRKAIQAIQGGVTAPSSHVPVTLAPEAVNLIKSLLDQQEAKFRLAMLEQQKTYSLMMDKMYQALMQEWVGEGEARSLFSPETDIVSARIVEARSKVSPGVLPVSTKPVSHKPRVLVVGALDSMKRYYQEALPNLQVEVTKKAGQIHGDWALVVVLHQKCGSECMETVKSKYPNQWISVPGVKTRAIEAIKNHLNQA